MGYRPRPRKQVQRGGPNSVNIQAGDGLTLRRTWTDGDIHDLLYDADGNMVIAPSGRARCAEGGKHLTCVLTVRQWWRPWRKLYLVGCFDCDLEIGPQSSKEEALNIGKRIEEAPGASPS